MITPAESERQFIAGAISVDQHTENVNAWSIAHAQLQAFISHAEAKSLGLLSSYTQEERARMGRSGARPRGNVAHVVIVDNAPHSATERVTAPSEDE